MATFQEISIPLADGYPAYARWWPAPGATEAVLHLHGIQSHCGWYEETARRLCEAGFAVLQPDRRGSGHNQQDRAHADASPQLIEDVLVCRERLRELAGVDRIHLVGVSWGGKLVAAVHATNPKLAASLTLVAPGLYPVVDVSGAEKFRIGWAMLSDPTKHFDIPLNDPELFTDDPEKIRFLEEDPLTLHQASAGFYLASRRMDKTAAKITEAPPVPLYVLLAGEERIIDNERTAELVRGLDWPHRRLTRYDRSRHTIEFGPDREQFWSDLVNWLRAPESGIGRDVRER